MIYSSAYVRLRFSCSTASATAIAIDSLSTQIACLKLRRSLADIFLEVYRAVDILNKSGKLFNLPTSRRDSMPMMGGAQPFSDFSKTTSRKSPSHARDS